MTQPPLKVLSITGTGRSGSTVLEMLVAQHLGGVSIGEVKYLWERGLIRNELCSCGEKTQDCPFWASVLARAFPEGVNPEDINALRLRVERHRHFVTHRLLGRSDETYRKDRAAYVDILRRLFASIQEETGAAMIIDGSKDPAHVDLVAEAINNTTILHLVRDSRGMAYSWATPKVRKEVHWEVEYMPALSAMTSIRDWLFINLGTEMAFSKLPNYTRIRYEDIVEGQLDVPVLCDQLALPKGTDYISHSVSGNPMRFNDGPITLSPDRRWIGSYSLGKRLFVTFMTAPILLRYKYALWPRRSS